MNTFMRTIGLTAAVGVGALAVGSALPVGAQEDPPATEQGGPDRAGPPFGVHPPFAARLLDAALDGLVEDGTLTQEQADAVKAAVREQFADHPLVGHPLAARMILASFEVAAETIGVPVEDLRAAVRAGQSVADVAEENGVDPATVVDALVAAGTERIDEAVAAGNLTEERAEEMKANLPEMAERFVNFTPPTD